MHIVFDIPSINRSCILALAETAHYNNKNNNNNEKNRIILSQLSQTTKQKNTRAHTNHQAIERQESLHSSIEWRTYHCAALPLIRRLMECVCASEIQKEKKKKKKKRNEHNSNSLHHPNYGHVSPWWWFSEGRLELGQSLHKVHPDVAPMQTVQRRWIRSLQKIHNKINNNNNNHSMRKEGKWKIIGNGILSVLSVPYA